MHNKTFQMALLALLVVSVSFVNLAQAEDPPGKKLFVTNKCNTCHSIESQGITKTLASSKAPDQSKVGSERNAEWLTKYLLKTQDLNGKKHAKAWTGKKEDLAELVKWLETLKSAEKK